VLQGLEVFEQRRPVGVGHLGTVDVPAVVVAGQRGVELDEGARFIANIIDTDPAKIKIGARVEVSWDKITEDFVYPAFKVVEG